MLVTLRIESFNNMFLEVVSIVFPPKIQLIEAQLSNTHTLFSTGMRSTQVSKMVSSSRYFSCPDISRSEELVLKVPGLAPNAHELRHSQKI